MEENSTDLQEIKRQTELGNPARPQGEAGALMLQGMNEHHKAVTEWGLSFFDYQANDSILDIGCGGGATLQRLWQRVGPQGKVTGVDYSAVSVEQSRQFNAKEIASGKIAVVEGSVEALPFPNESFDKIVTVECFYFWPNPLENLREVLRVLRPQGKFLIIADIYEHSGLSAYARDNVAKFNMLNPTVSEFNKLLSVAGFREVVVHTVVGEDWVCAEGYK